MVFRATERGTLAQILDTEDGAFGFFVVEVVVGVDISGCSCRCWRRSCTIY